MEISSDRLHGGGGEGGCNITKNIRSRDLSSSSHKSSRHELNRIQSAEVVRPELNFNWFRKIKLKNEEWICFPESNQIVNSKGERIGKSILSIESSLWDSAQCFLVNFHSTATIDKDTRVGTSITSFITPTLKVIQELGQEWCITKNGDKFEKKYFIIDSASKALTYSSEYKINNELRSKVNNLAIPPRDLPIFITEGSNLVFQRYLAHFQPTGNMSLKTVNYTGATAPVDYHCLGKGIENIGGVSTEVFGIRRSFYTLINKSDEESWDSMLDLYGHLVLKCQPFNNSHALTPLWFRPLKTLFKEIKPKVSWHCDPQLHSAYLVKKGEYKSEFKTYLRDHAELRGILSDFLQRVLEEKPTDIVEFGRSFFTPLLQLHLENIEQSSDSDTDSSCPYSDSASSSTSQQEIQN